MTLFEGYFHFSLTKVTFTLAKRHFILLIFY